MKAPLDVQLREYSDFFDEQLRDITVEDILSHPVSDGSVRPLQPRKPAPPLRLNLGRRVVVTGAAALILAVLIGAAALLLRSSGEEAPPATDPPVTPTTSAPVTETGSVDTPLGTLHWTSVSDLVGLFPGGLRPVATPAGFAAVERLEGLSLWTSPDGFDWEQRPVPFTSARGAELVWEGDRGWVVTDEPVSLWTSTDVETWTQIDLSVLQPPPSRGLVWSAALVGRPAAVGSTTLVQWTAWPDLPLDDIFGREIRGVEDLGLDYDWSDPDPVYEVIDMSDGDPVVARITLEGTPSDGTVVDVDTGEVLHEFSVDLPDGWPQDPLAFELDFTWNLLAVIDPDGTVTTVDTPWGMGRDVAVSSVKGTAVALATDGAGEAGEAELWTSQDGIVWRPETGPMNVTEADAVMLFSYDGTLYVDVDSGLPSRRWVFTDGSSWLRLAPPEGFEGGVRFADGYVLFSMIEQLEGGLEGRVLLPRPALWVSANGADWEEVPTDRIFPLSRDLGRGVDFELAVAGEKLFVSATDGSNELVGLWVLELSPGGGS